MEAELFFAWEHYIFEWTMFLLMHYVVFCLLLSRFYTVSAIEQEEEDPYILEVIQND